MDLTAFIIAVIFLFIAVNWLRNNLCVMKRDVVMVMIMIMIMSTTQQSLNRKMFY